MCFALYASLMASGDAVYPRLSKSYKVCGVLWGDTALLRGGQLYTLYLTELGQRGTPATAA